MSPTNVKDNSLLINDRILNLLNEFDSAKSIGLFYPYKNDCFSNFNGSDWG